MKRLTYFFTTFVTAVTLVLPAGAQNGRANNGANKQQGKERAEEVQLENKKGTVAPGVETAETKDKQHNGKHKHKGWSKRTKHKAEGHNK